MTYQLAITETDFTPINHLSSINTNDTEFDNRDLSQENSCGIVWIYCNSIDQNRIEVFRNANILNIMFAAEKVLKRDWETPEEDEAWAHL